MTDHDAIAAQVRQDRETGTPGPWQSGIIEDGGPFAVGDRDCWPICKMAAAPGPHNGANARRIATLPDLEAAYLDLYDEVKRLRADRMEVFGDHAHVVRGIIAAAGALPDMHDGPFREGFMSGIEEVAARADIHAGDGGRQMLDLAGQIVDVVQGYACIVMLPARDVIEKLARAAKAEAERDRLRAALDEIATAASGIAHDLQIGPDDEGRDIYEMALAIRDDARDALKGPDE